MPKPRLIRALPLLLLAAACVDEPTAVSKPPEPEPGPRVISVLEVTITGMAGPGANLRADVKALPYGPSQVVTAAPGSAVVLESGVSARLSHGTRGQGGHRYFYFTTLVRNTTANPLQNVTLIPVAGTTTLPGSPFRTVTRYDGTAAPQSLVDKIVPAGAVTAEETGSGLRAAHVDVLQVFDPSELSGITLSAPDTSLFPYGFVVRNRRDPNSRTLPVAADANDYAGVVTFSFRHPLPALSTEDPNSYTFRMLVVEDSETRMTESIEEGQDTAAVRMIRERATALGATTVTVLAGSSAMDPAVPDYPGQRQICTVRATGPSGAPTAYITEPAAYARIQVRRPGESHNACAAYFRTGTPGRPAQAVAFPLTVAALDLYGNVITTAVDSVRLEHASGTPVATFGPRTALVSGQATINATYTYAGGYGTSVLRAQGRRNEGLRTIPVAGVTRTWTGNVSTDGSNGANWDVGSGPGTLDTAYIPAGRPFYPVSTVAGTIGGLIMESGATFTLGAFDLTVNSLVWTEPVGGITSTTGRLILAGSGLSATTKGNLPRMQVTGSYTLAGPVVSRARVELAGGRLRTTGFRLQTTSF